MVNALPRVQAIILTWNKKSEVLSLLRQLKNIRYPEGFLSVLVVDNASADRTAEAISTGHPDVALIRHKENRGGAGGFNAGMRWALRRQTRPDYLWLLDDDVCVHPKALITLVQVLESRPNAAICGSRIMDSEHRDRMIEVGAFIDFRRGRTRRNVPCNSVGKAPNAVYEVDYVAACSLLARTTMVEKVGFWQEQLFIYWDDMEWGTRFNAAGFEVLASCGSIVYHPSWTRRSADHTKGWRTYYRVRNSLWFFNTYGSGPSKNLLLCKLVATYGLAALVHAIQANTDISHAYIRGIEDYLSGDFGKKVVPENALSLFEAVGKRKAGRIMVKESFRVGSQIPGLILRALRFSLKKKCVQTLRKHNRLKKRMSDR
jgi:GT2 family glycosyltransferase